MEKQHFGQAEQAPNLIAPLDLYLTLEWKLRGTLIEFKTGSFE